MALVQRMQFSVMKVLYITCFEGDISGGIYKSQVIDLLVEIRKQFSSDVGVTLLAILPCAYISRRRPSLFSLGRRREIADARKMLESYGVSLDIMYVPFIGWSSWSFYLPIPFLITAMAYIVPALICKLARTKYDVIHCRSYLAGLAGLLARRFISHPRVIFDVRGFYPEEAVVQGCWKLGSLSYRMWKLIERSLFAKADIIVCLSDRFQEHVTSISATAHCRVVFASVRSEDFCLSSVDKLKIIKGAGLGCKLLFVYSGSLGAWHTVSAIGSLFHDIKSSIPDAGLLVLSNENSDFVRSELAHCGLNRSDYSVLSVRHEDVPHYLAAADWGIIPLRHGIGSNYAMHVIADTMIGLKVAEYLSAGLPLIVNVNVGGLRSLLKSYAIGITFDLDHCGDVGVKIKQADSATMGATCRKIARELFDVRSAAAAYCSIYADLVGARISFRESRSFLAGGGFNPAG